MRKLSAFLAAALLAAVSFSASAQTAPSVDSTVKWTNPTTDKNGQPLTGANAITKIQIFVASSPILDTSTVAPFAELIVGTNPAPGTQYVYSAPAGSTVYARVKACTQYGCSVYSNQASKVLPFPTTTPMPPTGVDIVIVVTPPTADSNVGTLSLVAG